MPEKKHWCFYAKRNDGQKIRDKNVSLWTKEEEVRPVVKTART
jgi:hypothetical protein